MNCREFQAWLDAGRPGNGAAAARERAHASGCPRCAARLAADLEIDALLQPAPARAPARFTDVVMARIQAGAAADAPGLAAPFPDLLPWWVRAAADPACAAAAVLAGM